MQKTDSFTEMLDRIIVLTGKEQQEIAELLGVDPDYLSQLKRKEKRFGEQPPGKFMRNFRHVFQLELTGEVKINAELNKVLSELKEQVLQLRGYVIVLTEELAHEKMKTNVREGKKSSVKGERDYLTNRAKVEVAKLTRGL